MEGDYDACLNHLAAALGKYEPLLLPFASDSPDGGVRFEFALGPVLVQGVLRRNLSFEVEAKDSRVGPLVQAAHRLTGLPGFQEVLASALRQFETYAKGETENLDWRSQGVPWWDASKDEFLARDWLASREGAQASDDVDDRVLELTQTDLDPPRGWR